MYHTYIHTYRQTEPAPQKQFQYGGLFDCSAQGRIQQVAEGAQAPPKLIIYACDSRADSLSDLVLASWVLSSSDYYLVTS